MAPTSPARRTWVLVVSALSCTACGKTTTEPDPTVSELVGDWNAVSMVITSEADPGASVDLIDQGASFFLNIQPSGGYTSSLTFLGATATELGNLEVEGNRLIFFVEVAPTGPRVDTATFRLQGDELELEGETVFDFDRDGLAEAASLDAALER